jgi:hypothetical protein
MESRIGIEGKWAIDAPLSLTLALARRIDIADKLAGSRWQLARHQDGTMTGKLRRGPVKISLAEDNATNSGRTLCYRLTVERFGFAFAATVEMDCQAHPEGGSVVSIKLAFDDSAVLRFVPKALVDQRLLSLQQAILLTYEQALEALSSDRTRALEQLGEGERKLLQDCLEEV